MRNSFKLSVVVSSLGLLLLRTDVSAEPPFWGTIFIERNILNESDPSSYQTLVDKGRGFRMMYDRRCACWVTLNAFLFEAAFDDGLKIEVQVNPEFETTAAARTETLRYMHATGQLPTALRADVQTMWIHKGVQPFGGGNNNLLIHSGQADAYIQDGILEETLMHEASHTSLDAKHANAAGWVAAQNADGEFISNYARDYSTQEDIAETFVPYFAVQFRRDRLQPAMLETILRTIPNRIRYLDSQQFAMGPSTRSGPLAIFDFRFNAERQSLVLSWVSRPGATYVLETSTSLGSWHELPGEVAAFGFKTTIEIARAESSRTQFFRIRERE